MHWLYDFNCVPDNFPGVVVSTGEAMHQPVPTLVNASKGLGLSVGRGGVLFIIIVRRVSEAVVVLGGKVVICTIIGGRVVRVGLGHWNWATLLGVKKALSIHVS